MIWHPWINPPPRLATVLLAAPPQQVFPCELVDACRGRDRGWNAMKRLQCKTNFVLVKNKEFMLLWRQIVQGGKY